MDKPAHILVIRFSAMGDVAMTVPVIKNVLHQNPQLQVTVISNGFFAPMFDGIDRCHFYGASLKTDHKGIAGLFRLFRSVKTQQKFDAIIDLHNVLRSTILTTFFAVAGVQSFTIDKGRSEKKALTRKENKILQPLTSMHERYADVFRKAGLNVVLDTSKPTLSPRSLPGSAMSFFSADKKTIGIAPFAQYQEKMYPIDHMKNVVMELAEKNYSILLFGGGKTEADLLQQWERDIPNAQNVAGKFTFKEELAIISHLKLMVSMDSANMHLASLFNVPVVSIWGTTHPYAGFYGWGQQIDNIVQADLYCRPCSVFGNKPCYRGDHACMKMIAERMIVERILSNV